MIKALTEPAVMVGVLLVVVLAVALIVRGMGGREER